MLCIQQNKVRMGFHDINVVNLAMLAKQPWRLKQGTHSLFYGVYKACYLPNCSFMDAKLGSNSSYIWHSLLQARELIKEGSLWKILESWTVKVSIH